MQKNQRSIKNKLIDPDIQLKLAGVVILTLGLQAAIVYSLYQYSLKDLLSILSLVSGASGTAMELVNEEVSRFVWWMAIGMASLSLVSSVFIIFQTHKILGAAFAVTRHIQQNLLAFNFRTPLKLRSGDGLENLCDAINELSGTLEKSFPENQRPKLSPRATSAKG